MYNCARKSRWAKLYYAKILLNTINNGFNVSGSKHICNITKLTQVNVTQFLLLEKNGHDRMVFFLHGKLKTKVDYNVSDIKR